MHLGVQFGVFGCKRGNEIPRVRPMVKKHAYHDLGIVRKGKEKNDLVMQWIPCSRECAHRRLRVEQWSSALSQEICSVSG